MPLGLHDFQPPPLPRMGLSAGLPITVKWVREFVAHHFQVPCDALQFPSKWPDVQQARIYAMYLTHKLLPDETRHTIGQSFHCQDQAVALVMGFFDPSRKDYNVDMRTTADSLEKEFRTFNTPATQLPLSACAFVSGNALWRETAEQTGLNAMAFLNDLLRQHARPIYNRDDYWAVLSQPDTAEPFADHHKLLTIQWEIVSALHATLATLTGGRVMAGDKLGHASIG